MSVCDVGEDVVEDVGVKIFVEEVKDLNMCSLSSDDLTVIDVVDL